MKQDLLWLPGVEAVHSLNIWALTMDKVVVSVHLAVGMLQLLLICINSVGYLDLLLTDHVCHVWTPRAFRFLLE